MIAIHVMIIYRMSSFDLFRAICYYTYIPYQQLFHVMLWRLFGYSLSLHRALVRVPPMQKPTYRTEITTDDLRYQQSISPQDYIGANANITWYWRRNDRFVVPFTSDESAAIETLYGRKGISLTAFAAKFGLAKTSVQTGFGELEFDFLHETGMVIVGQPAM